MQLLKPFHDTTCWRQATSSAAIKPGIRCRFWFWLSRPVDGAEAKGWLKDSPVDRTLYDAVTLHYVAAPLLGPGTPDPVIRRQGARQGLMDLVQVPAALPRVEALTVAAVRIAEAELTDDDLVALATAALRSSAATEIQSGERRYADRSTGLA